MSGPNFNSTSPQKTLSSLMNHRNSALVQISKRKRETLLQEKRLQNLDKFLHSPYSESLFPTDSLTKSAYSSGLEGVVEQDFLNSLEYVVKILVHLIAGEKSRAEKILKETGGSLKNLFREIGQDENGDFRREAWLILSEIVLHNEKTSQVLIDDEECLMKILKFVKEDSTEGVWILVNLTKNLNFGRITKLVECGILDCFVEILYEDDVETVGFGLEGIVNVLKCGDIMASCQGERRNLFVEELEMNGGVGKIDDLQWSENDEIHKKAERILDEFFGDEEEFCDYDGMENSM